MLPAREDDVTSGVSKRRKNRKRRKRKNVVLDDASRLQKKARYLLIKIKMQQNLIEAYAGEGWKGQSREKIRPEKELQRAYKQILKCKLGIRDAIHQLQILGSVGSIEDSVIAPDGSVHHEHIICATCKLREAFPDNDIILCDGICNCAFHQQCLDPPLSTENIPPEDQGWFCKFCQCRMDIIDVMNAHLGTQYSPCSDWQDIFSEEACVVDGADDLPNAEVEWPSEDSDDDDYDPEKNDHSCSTGRLQTEESSSLVRSNSVSISWSYEDEAFSDLGGSQHSGLPPEVNSAVSKSCADSPGNMPDMIVGSRQRRTVDYKKLYFEMFGKDPHDTDLVSEDEDWGPGKRKRRGKDSCAANKLMSLSPSEKNDPDETVRIKGEHHQVSHIKHRRRPFFRIPPDAVEKLRQVFAEDELPSKSVRENLSKSLGLSSEKVNKWFKNARYFALRNRKMEGTPAVPNSNHTCSDEHQSSRQCKENKKSSTGTPKEDSSAKLQHTSIIKQGGCLASNLKKKNRHRKTLLGLSGNCKKVIMEFSEDLSLKQQLQLLKSNAKSKILRCTNFKERFNNQTSKMETEMERLSTIKNKVNNMLENLSVILKKPKTSIPKANLQHEQAVIHVPYAVVKEKISAQLVAG